MFGATPAQAEPRYIGWGTGIVAGSVTSTDLSTPGTEGRAVGASSQFTTLVVNDTHQVVATIICSVPKTVTNIGIFDGPGTGSPPTGGLLYAIFDGLNQSLNAGDSIVLTARVQYV